jgi:xyloglucan fucosyltransferase
VRLNWKGQSSLHNKVKQCRSKYKQHCYWKLKNYVPQASFLRVLRKYEAHHRQCTEGHPLAEYALKGLTPPSCKYLIWRDLDGKGNQLISLVSAFVYALLTNRVLLITRGANIQNLLCDPFDGSSWLLPEDFQDDRIRESSEMHGMFYDRVLNLSSTGKKEVIKVPPRLEMRLDNWQKPSDLRFFCEGEQNAVQRIPWLFYHSNEYSVPGFYYIKSFRIRLNTWFPDRAVFLHAGRYLLNPQNEIWDEITSLYRFHMADADRRLAIQVRAWGNEYNPIISDHILSCAQHAGLLPNSTASSRLPKVVRPY